MSTSGIFPSEYEPNEEFPHPFPVPTLPIPELNPAQATLNPEEIHGCQIKQGILSLVKDWQWTFFFRDLFTAASNICKLISESKTAEIVPILNIISSPIRLYHAFKDSIIQLDTMVTAAKVSKIGEAFFWGFGAASSMTTVVSDIIKPVSNGVALLGLTSIPAVSTTFTFIVPIVLIAFCAIGYINQSWSLIRSNLALHDFSLKKKGVFTLNEMETLLTELSGPTQGNLSEHAFKLEKKEFEEFHFTNDNRRLTVQQKIAYFMMRTHDERLTAARGALNQLLPMIQRLEQRRDSGSFLSDIELTLADCNEAIHTVTEQGIDAIALVEARNQLEQLKKSMMSQGMEIIDTVHTELHRHIMNKIINVICLFISMLAVGLMILYPNSTILPTSLLSSATALSILNFIFDKSVSQEAFLTVAQALRTVENQ